MGMCWPILMCDTSMLLNSLKFIIFLTTIKNPGQQTPKQGKSS